MVMFQGLFSFLFWSFWPQRKSIEELLGPLDNIDNSGTSVFTAQYVNFQMLRREWYATEVRSPVVFANLPSKITLKRKWCPLKFIPLVVNLMLHNPTTIYMVFETTMQVYEDLNTSIQIAAEKMWLC